MAPPTFRGMGLQGSFCVCNGFSVQWVPPNVGLAPSTAWRDLRLHPPAPWTLFMPAQPSPRASQKEPEGRGKREGGGGGEGRAVASRKSLPMQWGDGLSKAYLGPDPRLGVFEYKT